MSQSQNDEIDLFELFQILWDGKWIVITFSLVAILFGSIFIFSKEPVYESKLIYSVDAIPPFYSDTRASTDFRKKFYSIKVFEAWRRSSDNTSLEFEDFSETEVVDGFILSKSESENEQLATFAPEKKGASFVLVKSNHLPILDDFFRYSHYVNELLKKEYVVRAKDELRLIETRFKDLASADSNIVKIVLSIDRFIVAAEQGSNVIAIQHPTRPEKVSPKTPLIIIISAILGLMIGIFFTLIRNAVVNRKE